MQNYTHASPTKSATIKKQSFRASFFAKDCGFYDCDIQSWYTFKDDEPSIMSYNICAIPRYTHTRRHKKSIQHPLWNIDEWAQKHCLLTKHHCQYGLTQRTLSSHGTSTPQNLLLIHLSKAPPACATPSVVQWKASWPFSRQAGVDQTSLLLA